MKSGAPRNAMRPSGLRATLPCKAAPTPTRVSVPPSESFSMSRAGSMTSGSSSQAKRTTSSTALKRPRRWSASRRSRDQTVPSEKHHLLEAGLAPERKWPRAPAPCRRGSRPGARIRAAGRRPPGARRRRRRSGRGRCRRAPGRYPPRRSRRGGRHGWCRVKSRHRPRRSAPWRSPYRSPPRRP